MPDFNLRIKVDPSGAPAAIESVKKPLDELEAKGPVAGESVSKGMKEAASGAEQAATSVRGAGESMREASEHGLRLEGVGNALAAQGGELGAVFQQLATGAAIEATALAALVVEAVHLGDEYIELSNKALRLVTSQDQVDDALRQQLTLSRDMHTSLGQAMELSVQVKQRTDELGLTQKQQIDLTRELGQAALLSGRSSNEAAGALDRLGFALQSGVGGGRAMREVLRDFPPLAKAMEESLGKTEGQIIEMANKGKLSMYDLTDALEKFGGALNEQAEKRAESASEQWDHFKDELTVTLGKIVEDTGAIQALGEAFHGLAVLIEAGIKPLQLLLEGLDKAAKFTGDESKMDFLARLGGFGDLNDIKYRLEDMKKAQDEVVKSQFSLTRAFADGKVTLGQYSDAFGFFVGRLEQLGPKGLFDPWAEGMTKVNHALSDEQKMIEAIDKPMQDLIKNEVALAKAWGDGAINMAQHRIEAEKLKETLEGLYDAQAKLTAKSLDRELGFSDNFLPGMKKGLGGLENAGKDVGGFFGAAMTGDPAKETKEWDEALKKYDEQVRSTVELLDKAFNPLTDQILKWTNTGKFSFKEMANSIIEDIERMILKWAEMKVVEEAANLIHGGSAAPTEKDLMNLFSFANGGDVEIPRAANGYSGVVGGGGATDSKLFMARVSPREHISIRTPEQAAQQQGGQPTTVHVHNIIDKKQILGVFRGPEGKRVIVDVLRDLQR